VNESENSPKSQRGYNADAVWYHSMPEHVRQEERNVTAAASELEGAASDLEQIRSVLSEVRSLVHAVQVSSVVLEDVRQLCHGLRAAMEDSFSTRDYLSARARAGASRDKRAGHDQHSK